MIKQGNKEREVRVLVSGVEWRFWNCTVFFTRATAAFRISASALANAHPPFLRLHAMMAEPLMIHKT